MQLERLIHPRKIALFLGGLALYFALQSLVMEYLIENMLDAHAHSTLIALIDLFSVNAERTIPTWYSTLLLFGAAVVLMLIALAQREAQSKDARYWTGLSLIFLYLSMDEGAVIHEIVADALQTNLTLTGYLYFAWQIVAVPLVLLFLAVYLRFLFQLPAQTRNLFILAGAIYGGGALFIEGISANQWYVDGRMTYTYLMIATVEEFCEMLGVVIFIYALLAYAAERGYSFAFQPIHRPARDPAKSDITDTSGKLLQFSPKFRTVVLVICLIVGANLALIAWAFSHPQLSADHSENPISTAFLMEQLTADDVTVLRMNGLFIGDDVEAPLVFASLLDTFEEVNVISLPAINTSFALATDELPFDQAKVTEVMHANGIIQFIFLDTASVKAIVGNLQSQ